MTKIRPHTPTGFWIHNDHLIKEKAAKPYTKGDGENSPPLAGGSTGRGPKVSLQQVCRVNMIFKGIESKRARRQAIKDVYTLVPDVPQYLDWSDSVIPFDQSDHPDFIPNPGQPSLVRDSTIGGCQLTKVLMDGGSGINILYVNTMKKMWIPLSCLRPSPTPFHGIVPKKRQSGGATGTNLSGSHL